MITKSSLSVSFVLRLLSSLRKYNNTMPLYEKYQQKCRLHPRLGLIVLYISVRQFLFNLQFSDSVTKHSLNCEVVYSETLCKTTTSFCGRIPSSTWTARLPSATSVALFTASLLLPPLLLGNLLVPAFPQRSKSLSPTAHFHLNYFTNALLQSWKIFGQNVLWNSLAMSKQ